MGALWDVQLVLSEQARMPLLELLAYGARVDGPLREGELGALQGAARALDLRRGHYLAEALARAESEPLPPSLEQLYALERWVAVGALIWMMKADGRRETPHELTVLEYVAERAGVSPSELLELREVAERVQRHCRGRTTWSVEFELLLLELLHVDTLAPQRDAGPAPAPASPADQSGLNPAQPSAHGPPTLRQAS
jgi:uncharacterized tellurite resistance protein B-like protein